MNQEKQGRFIALIRSSKNVYLAQVAKEADLDWYGEVQPELESNAEFKTEVHRAILEIKAFLLNKVVDVALNGRAKHGRVPELSFINAAIKLIDSGVILGEKMKDDILQNPTTPSEEEIEERLKRMNLHEESKKEH